MVTPIAPRIAARTGPRVLPHNIDAEASVLGGIILRNEVLVDLVDLRTDDFYDPKHKIVFEAVRNLEADAKPIDVVTLESEVERYGKLEALGGIAFLGELALRVPTTDNVLAYADIVKVHSRNRQLILATSSATDRAYDWPHEPAELFDELLGELEAVRTGDRMTAGAPQVGYGGKFLDWLGDTEPSADPADTFDAHGLIVRAEPSLFLGEPKVGKTLTITDLALHLAAGRREWCQVPLYRRCKVLAFLHEDSEQTTRRRIFQMCRGAGIESWELDGYLEIDCATPLYFDKPQHLAALARKIRGGDFDVVLIDSLSTIHNGDENSVESMAPVMNAWRDLALTTKTAIAIIHHFRKRGQDGRAPEPGTGVLQRARGSSIIGATTRHAVGISAGPERGQIVIDVESNHDITVDPFVVQRLSGIDPKTGRAFLTHKRLGSLREARMVADSARIKPVVSDIVKAHGDAGISGDALRKATVERLRDLYGTGARNSTIDQAARDLEAEGRIERNLAKKWRAS